VGFDIYTFDVGRASESRARNSPAPFRSAPYVRSFADRPRDIGGSPPLAPLAFIAKLREAPRESAAR